MENNNNATVPCPKICEFSSDTFGGFQHPIDLKTVESKGEIVCMAVSALDLVLSQNKLTYLLLKLRNTQFHIHTSFMSLLTSPDEKIWICECNPRDFGEA